MTFKYKSVKVHSNCCSCGKPLVEGQWIVTIHQYFYCDNDCRVRDSKVIQLGSQQTEKGDDEMYPLKTREEMHYAYLEEIELIENHVISEEVKISKAKTEIERHKRRIEGLKETAEMYAPKSK